MKKILLIDTFNLLHRAYHALPPTFRDENGEPTNAVYGVTSMLINLLDLVKPDYIVAALDGEKPNFRVEDFTGYKAHRKPMDNDLSVQIPKVFEILDAFGIKKIVVDGYEADDVIGTLTTRLQTELEVYIVSNDRDLWQLSQKNVFIMLPGKKGNGEFEFLSFTEAESRLGFSPAKIADYKGLRGDPSDNLPGVFGVGEKTAAKLIIEYGSLENLYQNLASVKPDSLREKLTNCYEQALMSKRLAVLIMDAPFNVELNECIFDPGKKEAVSKVLERYHFKSLLRRLGFGEETPKDPKKPNIREDQLSLF